MRALAQLGRLEIMPDETGSGPESKLVKKQMEDTLTHFYKPLSRQWATPAFRFRDLKAQWEYETMFLSSVTDIAMHPAYQQIIGMGPVAIPYILNEMSKKPGHWFWALKSITGEDPVSAEKRGKIKDMTEAWLHWGREQAYLS